MSLRHLLEGISKYSKQTKPFTNLSSVSKPFNKKQTKPFGNPSTPFKPFNAVQTLQRRSSFNVVRPSTPFNAVQTSFAVQRRSNVVRRSTPFVFAVQRRSCSPFNAVRVRRSPPLIMKTLLFRTILTVQTQTGL
ncbi:uncharacterized protein [Cicer arietinum]|uniref:uncharacterized protein n=1 Tax=Cicer arietinum TaxID=3827 RepID=UPI0006412031